MLPGVDFGMPLGPPGKKYPAGSWITRSEGLERTVGWQRGTYLGSAGVGVSVLTRPRPTHGTGEGASALQSCERSVGQGEPEEAW